MSESIQSQWPSEAASYEKHRESFVEGIGVIRDNLILPSDMRYEIAYAALAAGDGQKNAVSIVGGPGTGKTSFGDILFGSDKRVEISADDVYDTLYGYVNPINRDQIIPGKLIGLTAEDQTANLNEIPNLKNTGPLHPFMDKATLDVNGVTVPMRDVAIYMTGNFADGARNNKHDEAWNSRKAMELLAGDYSLSTLVRLQSFNAGVAKDRSKTPILPVARKRRAFHDAAVHRYETKANNGKYIVDLLRALNETGMLIPINAGDARQGETLHEIARARMIVEDANSDKKVGPDEIASIAALVLPSSTELSNYGRQHVAAQFERRPTDYEKQIGVRRLIAHVATAVLFEQGVQTPCVLSQASAQAEKAMELNSYANPGALDPSIDIDRAMLSGSKRGSVSLSDNATTKGNEDGKRSFFRRGR